jgi:hypothetical protein
MINMKMSGISLFMILTLSALANMSCKKTEATFMDDATITGPDLRTCPCCGGLMITFNGETRPYTGDFKLIENGTQLGIKDNEAFPIFVKVDWKTDSTNICHHIIITRIARR